MMRIPLWHGTLQGTLRVLVLICVAWLSPMQGAAAAGTAARDAAAVQGAEVSHSGCDGACAGHHTGVPHDLACAITCAGSPTVGPAAPLVILGAATRAAPVAASATAAAGNVPDPALRPPDPCPIA